MLSFQEKFQAEGCLLIPRALGSDFVAELQRECADQIASDSDAQQTAVGDRRVMRALQLRGPLLDPRLHELPAIRGALWAILGRDIVVDSVTCVTALDGAEEQHLHRDHQPLFPELAAAECPRASYAVTVAIPLIPLTPVTGTTKIYLGSHLQDTVAGSEEILEPYTQPGGCFLMDYRLWHRGTPNRSGAPRPILYVVYARSWFTDHLQGRSALNPRQYQSLPAQQQRLFRRFGPGDAFLDPDVRGITQ